MDVLVGASAVELDSVSEPVRTVDTVHVEARFNLGGRQQVAVGRVTAHLNGAVLGGCCSPQGQLVDSLEVVGLVRRPCAVCAHDRFVAALAIARILCTDAFLIGEELRLFALRLQQVRAFAGQRLANIASAVGVAGSQCDRDVVLRTMVIVKFRDETAFAARFADPFVNMVRSIHRVP